ncbi:unnamed protein product [Linum tenue]|uniref:Uncharacterized protein n=1 Tax=Linum tenue TaxID=586396 RepID=A0AAV0LI63_9ROSI|nr:unnamed protein product [Linum tenue]
MAEPSPSKNLSTSSCGASVSRPANPHLRNSESADPKRRSFVGSPFPRPSINTGRRGSAVGCGGGFHPNTPANSPSDYCQRKSSIGKENVSMASLHNQKKEKDEDQIRKSGKVQSPAATAKGSKKHFMSPTISAASKALPVSSRKKVLVEPIRSSISFSGGKLPCVEGSVTKPEKGLNEKKEVSFDSNVTYLGEKTEEAVQSEDDLDTKVDSSRTNDGMASLLVTEIEEKDLVNLDPSFKISTRPGDPGSISYLASSDVPPLSPLDADPYIAPYDPKTNYLSPRPQFLRYKHNPLVELYLQKGRSGDLMDRFSTEFLSDSEVTEDGVSSDGFHVETDDLTSHVASDDGSYKKEEEDIEVFEADHTSASEADGEHVQVKKTVERHIVTRSKVIPILFILATVGLYLSFYSSPVMEPSVLNNLNFPELYVPPQLSNFARERFEQVTQKIQPLLHRYVSNLHKLILGFNQRNNMVGLEYANLTSLLEDNLVDEASVLFYKSALEMAATCETGLAWPVTGGDVNLVSMMKSHLIEATEEVVQGDVLCQESEDQEPIEARDLDLSMDGTSNEAEDKNMAEVLVDKSSLEAAVVVEEGQDNSEHLVPDTFAQVEGILGDSCSATLGVPEANMNMLAGTCEMQSIIGHQERTEVSQEVTLDAKERESEIDVTPATIQDQPITETREMASAHAVAGIAMLALVSGLLATIALFYRRTSRALPTTDAALASQKATRKMASPIPAPIEQNSQPPILSSNLLTEVECTGDDTCTSAMSASQPAASSHRKELNARGTSQEAWSHDWRGQRNYSRRESSASSEDGNSMESKSYGSFTTYEKFPAKQNVGGEGHALITPVRRSSRLRSKVGSSEQAT